jgi:hypothetical protein
MDSSYTKLRSDSQEINRMIAVLFRPGDVVELRIPNTTRDGTVSGYFDDFGALGKALTVPNGHYPSVYITLNPLKSSLLARSANHVQMRVKRTTSDKDVDSRRWLLIDCDAVRPADISSTDAEHEAALARARHIRSELAGEGWPAPILADSGNGGHLLYRIDLPNDEASTALLQSALKALASRYDDATVKIDPTVFNASRITKAYGTAVRKGDSIPERPHRISRMLDVPQAREIVSPELLVALSQRSQPHAAGTPFTGFTDFDMPGWLEEHGISAGPPEPYKEGMRWIIRCPFNPEHKDAAVFQFPTGRRGFHCPHASCHDKSWKALWLLLEGETESATAQDDGTAPSWDDPIPLRSRSVPPFAGGWFPGALGEKAVATAKATETPLELPALLGLAVVSSTVAGKAVVEVEDGYSEPLNLYTIVGLDSGNRKTGVLTEMTRPLAEYEANERKRLLPEIKSVANQRKTIEARIEYLRKAAAKSQLNTSIINQIADTEDSLPDLPELPQFWTQDVTPEKMAQLLQEHGERMSLFSDEGGIFDILAGRYSKGAIPNLDLFNQCYSGSPVRVERVSSPAVFLQRPLLSIGISPQPSVLQRLTETPAFRGRGLLARFLYAVPPSPVGRRALDPQPCPAAVTAMYRELVHRLIRLMPPTIDGVWQAWHLKLSTDAYQTWKGFQREVEALMTEGGRLHYLRDWGSKLPGTIARVAGVFHCVTEDLTQNVVVEGPTMQRAVDLGRALIEHALAAFDLMEEDRTGVDAQKILSWIEREQKQTFTLRECFCEHQSRFKRVAAALPALELLIEISFAVLAFLHDFVDQLGNGLQIFISAQFSAECLFDFRFHSLLDPQCGFFRLVAIKFPQHLAGVPVHFIQARLNEPLLNCQLVPAFSFFLLLLPSLLSLLLFLLKACRDTVTDWADRFFLGLGYLAIAGSSGQSDKRGCNCLPCVLLIIVAGFRQADRIQR